MRWSKVSSVAGVLVAAVASVATSAPEPDWTREDSVSGEVTLAAEAESTTIRVETSARAVDANLQLDVALDDATRRSGDPATTPVLLFASVTEEGKKPERMSALPFGYAVTDGGFDQGADRAAVPRGSEKKIYELRFAWASPRSADLEVSTYDAKRDESLTVTRTMAPRRKVTIRWRAKVQASGYDDPPAGAAVDIQEAP